ncbi:hypothetical protein DFJ77DRAFT_328014 [Powellomyces hirtus]|nr:hypothetical protein DFJ77DRAFT_328014 [Powellomyces hirtus]
MTVPTPSKAPVDQPWKWPTGSRKRRRNSEVADGSASDSEVLFPASKKHNKLTAEEDNEEDVGTAEAGKTGGGPDELETATSGNEVPDMLTAKEDAEKAAGTADAGTTGANTNGAGVKAQTSEAESMELHQMRRRKREMEASDDEEELIPMFTKYSKLTTETDDFSATQNRALKCFLSPQCTRLPAFTSVLGYEEHYAQAHVNVCKVCKRPKILPTRRLLDLHLMEVHDSFFAVSAERQAMYECFVDECPIKHSTIRQRRRHLMRVHGFPANFHFQVVEQGQQRDNYNYKPSTEEGQQNKQQNQENKKTKQKKLQNKLGEKKLYRRTRVCRLVMPSQKKRCTKGDQRLRSSLL